MEKRSYEWFEKRHRTKGLELAHDQIVKAFDTVNLLNKAMKSFAENDFEQSIKYIKNLYLVEEEVDRLRTEVFKELSKSAALLADYREDLLHLVKRLDTLADHTKDAARCIELLEGQKVPFEISEKVVFITTKLLDAAQTLSNSIEKISSLPNAAVEEAKKVADIEHDVDFEYLKTKSLFVKYGQEINPGVLIIFDDLIEFIEQAADMCADTADYIVVLSSRD
jgi:predicted phosphate transport protein (TIGR00153 family)